MFDGMRTDLRELIEQAGGLHSQAGLARRWDVSRAWANEAVHKPHFPQPAAFIDGDRPVWFGLEADNWRAAPRRPGPKGTRPT